MYSEVCNTEARRAEILVAMGGVEGMSPIGAAFLTARL